MSETLMMTGLSAAAMLLLVGCAALALQKVVRKARVRLADARRREEAAAQRFEQAVMRSFGIGDPEAPATVGPPTAAPLPGAIPGDMPEPLRAVARRLLETGCLIEVEEPMVLPDGTRGRRLRLRGSKTALLLPADPGVAAIANSQKLFDRVILVREDGSALVARDLGQFIADSILADEGDNWSANR